ncbi:chondroitin AC/alginate lyase [Mycena epipterygia]|nr:chondroitin AC/alginate lyase [Mycena epipterygia]
MRTASLGLVAVILAVSVLSVRAWIHPGILHKLSDMSRISSYTTAGLAGTNSPQYQDYLLFAADKFSSDAYQMSTPVATLISRASFEADATAAYQNALMWSLTGIELHAAKSIEIMNAWSGTLKSVDPNYLDMQLASSLGPFMMTNVAEIIRYTSAGWTASGISSFSSMLNNVFYPRLNNHTGVQYEANVGTGNTKALMAFGVFTENTTMYNEAISLYSNEKCSGLALDISSTGQSSESGRDQGHVQLGLYTAKYNLGNTVAYDATFQRCDANLLGGPFNAISTTGRGAFRPIYELAYAHYVSIRGLSMPFSLQIINQVATEEGNTSPADGSGWGTLKFRL